MTEPILHEIASRSVAAPGKPRNGDHCAQHALADENLVLLVVADGVGSHSSDWKASETACGAVVEAFVATNGPTPRRLSDAVRAAHRQVVALEGGHQGAASTLIAVAWQRGRNHVDFVNVGDSRLYLVSDAGAVCATTDDAADALLTRGGRPLVIDGAVGTARGITNAVGGNVPPRVTVQDAPFAPGGMLALTTDGCHGLPGFAGRLVEVYARPDLDAAIRGELFVNWPADDQDDATIVALRRRRFTDDLRARAAAALAAGEDPAEAGVPRHMMARHVVDHMLALLAGGEPSALAPLLDYLHDHGLRPSRDRLVSVLDAFVDDGRPETRRLFDRLVALAREA